MAEVLAENFGRRVAVAIPAKDEAGSIQRCLHHLDALRVDGRVASLHLHVLANNCSDHTVAIAGDFVPRNGCSVIVEEVRLPPAMANAGWARRLSFEAASKSLAHPRDLLLCTDADTRVAPDWLIKTLDHLDAGYDAVAGFARLDPRELRTMEADRRLRLNSIRRYLDALEYLKGRETQDEPWPRHFYEGGASIALTLEAYRRIGDAPTPPVGEDKALFDRLRAVGCRVRHPKDVRVLTSCRLQGRAPGGAADTLARWSVQSAAENLAGLSPMASALAPGAANDETLTFETLPTETAKARRLINELRRGESRLAVR